MLILTAAGGSKAQTLPEDSLHIGTLTVHVTGLKSARGNIMLAVFDSAESYKTMTDPFLKAIVPVHTDSCTWTAEDVPYGAYGIMIYHDENRNGKLDSNFLRIPKEAYGFSNNASGRFGPPDYEKIRFLVTGVSQTIEIHLQ